MIVKVEPNKPLALSLKYSSAQEKQGKYGKQFLYTLSEPDGVIYLPPIAHDEIQKLHAGPGEPFTLTKTIGQGNQAQWKVERIIAPGDPVGADQPDRPAQLLNERNYIAPKSITFQSTPDKGDRQQSITKGKSTVAVIPTAPTLATPQSKTLIRQLIATIDAVKVARDYAKQQGVDFEPTSRDICALAITGGIQVFKEGVY
jgi:hypothetical protein